MSSFLYGMFYYMPIPLAERSKANVVYWYCGFESLWGHRCMCVSFECCLLSGRSVCDVPITRPGVSYRLWCVIVCYLEP